MTLFLRDKIEKLFMNNYNKDQIIEAVNEIAKEREEKEKEKKLQAAREKVAEATADYMKLLTGIDMDVAEFIKDAIKEENRIKNTDFTKAEVKYKEDAVGEWLKENGLF